MLALGKPRLGDDRPERLPYIFLSRTSREDDLESAFIVAYEPYKDQPFLPKHPLSY